MTPLSPDPVAEPHLNEKQIASNLKQEASLSITHQVASDLQCIPLCTVCILRRVLSCKGETYMESFRALESLVCSEEGLFCRHAPWGRQWPKLTLVAGLRCSLVSLHWALTCQLPVSGQLKSVRQLLCHSLMILKLVLLLKGWFHS